MRHDITREFLDKVGACDRDDGERYSDERLARLFPGRESITPLELVRDRRIRRKDKVWLLCHAFPGDAVDFAQWLADRADCRHALGTDIAEWARRWMSAEDRSEAAASAAAAWASCYSSLAAYYSVWAACVVAARAARSAGVAGDAERRAQCAWWRKRLEVTP